MEYELFSKRQQRIQGETADTFQYETIPKELRVQIFYIWEKVWEKAYYNNFDELQLSQFAVEAYKSIETTMREEYDVLSLDEEGYGFYWAVRAFLLETEDTNKVIDIIEVSFRYIDQVIRDKFYVPNDDELDEIFVTRHPDPDIPPDSISPDEAIDQLNQRFREHSVEYQYESGQNESGQIVKVDSPDIHSEVVKPAEDGITQLDFKDYDRQDSPLEKSENVKVQNTGISDAFVEPSEETLWRYMSFAKFMDVLKNGLFFSKASLFNDPAEGHIPPKNVKQIQAIGEMINEKYHPKWEGELLHGSTPPFHSYIDTNGISRQTLCSCWYSQPNQSVSMWERYGSEGVAIKTTLKRVKEGVEGYGKYFRIGKIEYIDYDNTVDFNLNIRWENNQPHYDRNFSYRRFLHKQKEYQDENEVRLMILAEYHSNLLRRSIDRSEARTIPFKINEKWKNNWACLEIPTNGVHLPITPGILIKRVFVSNKAEPYMRDLIEQQFDDMGIQPRPKVEQSKLLLQQHIWD